MGYTNSVYPAWNGRLAWIEGLRGQTRIVRERAAAHPAPRLTAKPKRSTYGAIVILHSAICASFCLGSPARASLPTGLLVRPQGHRLARWRMLQIECPVHFDRPSPVLAGREHPANHMLGKGLFAASQLKRKPLLPRARPACQAAKLPGLGDHQAPRILE